MLPGRASLATFAFRCFSRLRRQCIKNLNRLRSILSGGLVVLHSQVYRIFLAPKHGPGSPGRDILIILPGGIGDGILFLGALEGLLQSYPARDGWRVSLLCSGPIRKFYAAIGIQDRAGLCEPPFFDPGPSGETPYRAYRLIFRYLKGRRFLFAWYAMSPSVLGACVLSVTGAKTKTGCIPDSRYGRLKAWLLRHAYTSAIPASANEFRMGWHKKVLRALGISGHKTAVPYIPRLDAGGAALRGEYILVCMGSSEPARRWEAGRFAALINLIAERWRLPVCLIGGTEERNVYESIKASLLYPASVYDYYGKTDLKQWVELIRGGRLLIGNDSGAVHLAAAVKTPSVCVLGRWHDGVYHPYRPEAVRDGDKLPVCVFPTGETPCAGCAEKASRRIGNSFGYGNPACGREVALGKPVLCLQAISVKDVYAKVAEQMAGEK